VIARLSIYANVDLDMADRMKAWMDGDGAGTFHGLPGYRGSMTLVDRDNARLVGIGFYDSAGHAREAEGALDEIYAAGREQLPADLRDGLDKPPESIGLFEVVHRD
jgi:hypothetical protein